MIPLVALLAVVVGIGIIEHKKREWKEERNSEEQHVPFKWE